MTVRPAEPGRQPALFGLEGELVSVRISVEPKLLEDLLEALAVLDFPINPQLYHRPAHVTVEFPAYTSHVEEVRAALRTHGFNPAGVELTSVLASVPAHLTPST